MSVASFDSYPKKPPPAQAKTKRSHHLAVIFDLDFKIIIPFVGR